MMFRHWAPLLALASTLQAQHIIYNQKQDQTAQDAVKAAKEITSGALFDTMARNLDLQAHQEIDTVLAYTREIMRADLVAFTFWGPNAEVTSEAGVPICKSLSCELTKLQGELKQKLPLEAPDDQTAAKALESVKSRCEKLQASAKQLQSAAKTKDPAVLELLSHLGDAKDIEDYAEQIVKTQKGNQARVASLEEIGQGLDETAALFDSVKGIWEGYEAIKVDPASLRPPREVVELKLLRLEEQHIKNLTRLRVMKQLEVGDVLRRTVEAYQFLGPNGAKVWDSPEEIDDTLAAASLPGANRDRLRFMLRGLLSAAAALAANDSADRLYETRLGQEERRYSILRGAVNSSTYDLTIQAAVERLGVYYKSGVKASDLAALIFFISNSVSVPVIAAK
jgi:hypothetical protein